jgi:hypothetical protein
MKYATKRNLAEEDLTEEFIYLENEKKKAAKEMDLEYHMIWYSVPTDPTDIDPVTGKLNVIGHIEERDVDVEEIFMMFPEINPVFFKNFNVEEIRFRFGGGTVVFKRKEK